MIDAWATKNKGWRGIMKSKIQIGLSALFAMTCLLLGSVGSTESYSPLSAGTFGGPLPWPFPSAKECPVNWSDYAGRYVLAATFGEVRDKDQYLELTVSVAYQDGLRFVKVSRYDYSGTLISEGNVVIGEEQRMLILKLLPVDPMGPVVDASIQLFYASNQELCTAENLVPVLTVGSGTTTDFQMVRVPKDY
jgi:hypothetical protein